MKKLFLFVALVGVAASCGPKRLGCGPGRCELAKEKKACVKPC